MTKVRISDAETVVFMYKCRYCGERYGGHTEASGSVAERILMDLATVGRCLDGKNHMSLMEVHTCGSGRLGLADMIGIKVCHD